jgi:hypothetical protein
MNDNTHPSKLPVADQALAVKLIDEASEYVTGSTPIALHTGKIMSQRLPLQAAIQVTEYVLYMAAFAVAEKEANKLGFTLREWSEEDALRTKEAFDAGMEAKRDQREAAQAGPTEADMQNVIDMLNRVRNKRDLH